MSNARNLARLLPNASGQLPDAAMASGSVLQVVQAVKTDTFSASAGSYVAVSGLSVSITPASSSNKVLITCQVQTTDSNNYPPMFHIYRNGVQITPSGVSSGYTPSGAYAVLSGGSIGGASVGSVISFTFLDSPNTSATTTYQVYGAKPTAAGSALYVNPTGNGGGSSSITLMEIAA